MYSPPKAITTLYNFISKKSNKKTAPKSDFRKYYILISASTPAGRLRFCKESIVFGVALLISIKRL